MTFICQSTAASTQLVNKIRFTHDRRDRCLPNEGFLYLLRGDGIYRVTPLQTVEIWRQKADISVTYDYKIEL